MSDTDPEVILARELQALIPGYLANREREIAALRAACAAADFAALRRIGHRMKGAGASYGFGRISAFGREIESAAKTADASALAASVDAYADYLARVQVRYT